MANKTAERTARDIKEENFIFRIPSATTPNLDIRAEGVAAAVDAMNSSDTPECVKKSAHSLGAVKLYEPRGGLFQFLESRHRTILPFEAALCRRARSGPVPCR